MNTEENRNKRRDRKIGKSDFVKHSGVGGFPKAVWLQRMEDAKTLKQRKHRLKIKKSLEKNGQKNRDFCR